MLYEQEDRLVLSAEAERSYAEINAVVFQLFEKIVSVFPFQC